MNQKQQHRISQTNIWFLGFQGVNRLFLMFNVIDNIIGHWRYYLPTKKVEVYNIMIDGRNSFDQPIKNDTRTYEKIQKVATVEGDDYTTGCLLDYNHLMKHKIIATD